MKSIKYLLVVFFMFIISTTIAFSDCPEGYQSGTIQATFTYYIGPSIFNCDITIHYCCKWDNSIKTLVFQVDTVESTLNNCMAYIPDTTYGTFNTWIHQTIVNEATGICTPEWPPCDDTVKYYFKTITYACKFYENRNISKIPNDPAYHLFLIKCQGSVECVSVWEMCYDYNYNPPLLVETLVDKYLTGTPDCDDEVLELPPSGKGWDEYWTTDCFVLPCDY